MAMTALTAALTCLRVTEDFLGKVLIVRSLGSAIVEFYLGHST